MGLGKCFCLRGNIERRMNEGLKKKLSGNTHHRQVETNKGKFHKGGGMLKKTNNCRVLLVFKTSLVALETIINW